MIVSSCQDEILNDSNPVIENVNVNLSMDEAMSIANDNPTNLSDSGGACGLIRSNANNLTKY